MGDVASDCYWPVQLLFVLSFPLIFVDDRRTNITAFECHFCGFESVGLPRAKTGHLLRFKLCIALNEWKRSRELVAKGILLLHTCYTPTVYDSSRAPCVNWLVLRCFTERCYFLLMAIAMVNPNRNPGRLLFISFGYWWKIQSCSTIFACFCLSLVTQMSLNYNLRFGTSYCSLFVPLLIPFCISIL